jgi:hypothetical protein
LKKPKIGKIKKIYFSTILKRQLIKLSKFFAKLSIKSAKFTFFKLRGANYKIGIFRLILLFLIATGVRTIYIQFEDTINTYIVLAKEQPVISQEEQNIQESVKITSSTTPSISDKNTLPVVSASPSLIDTRAYILDQYFKSQNSPLYGTGRYFVDACDNFGAPRSCLSVVAIAKHETNLCKYNISAQMFNCWGFGGSGSNRMQFNSFQESINRVTDVLVNQYGVEYMIDPRKMERTFCGPQDECIGWGTRVLKIMEDIDNYSAGLGLGRLSQL